MTQHNWIESYDILNEDRNKPTNEAMNRTQTIKEDSLEDKANAWKS